MGPGFKPCLEPLDACGVVMLVMGEGNHELGNPSRKRLRGGADPSVMNDASAARQEIFKRDMAEVAYRIRQREFGGHFADQQGPSADFSRDIARQIPSFFKMHIRRAMGP